MSPVLAYAERRHSGDMAPAVRASPPYKTTTTPRAMLFILASRNPSIYYRVSRCHRYRTGRACRHCTSSSLRQRRHDTRHTICRRTTPTTLLPARAGCRRQHAVRLRLPLSPYLLLHCVLCSLAIYTSAPSSRTTALALWTTCCWFAAYRAEPFYKVLGRRDHLPTPFICRVDDISYLRSIPVVSIYPLAPVPNAYPWRTTRARATRVCSILPFVKHY